MAAGIHQIKSSFLLFSLGLTFTSLLFGCTVADLGPVSVSNDPNDIHFYYHPNASNPDFRKEIILGNVSSLNCSGYQNGIETVYLLHGFRANSLMGMSLLIKNAFLASNLSVNVIVVEWGKLSTPTVPSSPTTLPLYTAVLVNIPVAALRLKQFVDFIFDNDVNATLQKTYFVGHCSGAHVSGLAGQYLQDAYNGTKVSRITGLDPAGPLYYPPVVSHNLNTSDADFVDVIHSNAGTLGVATEDGHAHFYPNGGMSQPGCPINDTGVSQHDVTAVGLCSHNYSYQLYAESVSNDEFESCECPDFQLAVGPSICETNCTNPVLLGYPCPPSTRGKYYLTASNPP